MSSVCNAKQIPTIAGYKVTTQVPPGSQWIIALKWDAYSIPFSYRASSHTRLLPEFESNPKRKQPKYIKANGGNTTDHVEDRDLCKHPIYPAPFFLEN